MINKAIYNIKLSFSEYRDLINIKPWTGKQWDNPPNNNISLIKDKIRQQLNAVQQNCSYCGLKLGGTSVGEIEHIAPKAYYRHPDFTFTTKNLTLSCHLCNGSSKKGTKDTINIKTNKYSNCDFLLVHPYYDDPNDHFEWTDNPLELLIQIKNNSAKGKFSIELFDLDSPKMSELRAQEYAQEKLRIKLAISNSDEDLLRDTMNYKT